MAGMAALLASAASAATFGRVVSIGGHAADIALDEPPGVLYIANYTASRIDMMSLSDYSVGRQIDVKVPLKGVPTGLAIPLSITQGGSSTSIPVRVVNQRNR